MKIASSSPSRSRSTIGFSPGQIDHRLFAGAGLDQARLAKTVQTVGDRVCLGQAASIPHGILDLDTFAANGGARPGVAAVAPAGHADTFALQLAERGDVAAGHGHDAAMAETAHDEVGDTHNRVITVMTKLGIAAEGDFSGVVIRVLAEMGNQRADAVDLKIELVGGDVTENQRRHVVPVTQCNSKAQCHLCYSFRKC